MTDRWGQFSPPKMLFFFLTMKVRQFQILYWCPDLISLTTSLSYMQYADVQCNRLFWLVFFQAMLMAAVRHLKQTNTVAMIGPPIFTENRPIWRKQHKSFTLLWYSRWDVGRQCWQFCRLVWLHKCFLPLPSALSTQPEILYTCIQSALLIHLITS